MGIAMDISQHEIEQIQDSNEIVSKIKLRRTSYANLMKHVKNIPYMAVQESVVEDSNTKLSAETDSVVITSTEYEEDKLTGPMPWESSENTYLSTNESADITFTENQDIVDISEYVTRLSDATQSVNNIKEAAVLAQQEALNSDEQVSTLSVEMTELEKQVADLEKKNSELDQQLLTVYMNQLKILDMQKKEFENIIEQENARRQDNENKVIQFHSRINDIKDRIAVGNENLAKKQETLVTLQSEFSNSDNIVDFAPMNEDDEKVRKIA